MNWKRTIETTLSLGLVGLLVMLPCYATAVLEGDEENGFAMSAVQLIEGDKVKSVAPPIPRLRADVTYQDYESPAEVGDITLLISMYNRDLTPAQVQMFAQTIQRLSAHYRLDPRLMASLVAVESSFRPHAISSSGAIGLGQLKPATAQWLGVGDPFDPIQNLIGVAKYLRYLLNRYNGSVQHALAAYFKGQGTIDRQGIDDGAMYYIGKINRVFARL